MYQVLARKWRPQVFDELVGQSHVSKTLTNAIGSDRLAHAYIFAGLRGTGKTTVARILAKCLNCETGPTARPCGTCDPCREIAESRAMDVMEIDAASRTKVEQTRELLEVVSYAPVRDRYKILIIDEAHMLSKASFNALLKTLEEPPPNVLFILATTEVGKIIPTILSRCQVFEFRRVGVQELTRHLRKICDAEKIRITDGSLERVARAGEGSVRDSLSLLERVLACCGHEVDDGDVLRLLGGVRAEVLTEMVGALSRRDAAGMLSVLDGLMDEGHDLNQFWTEYVAVIRDLLLLRSVPDRLDLLSRSPEEGRALLSAAETLSTEDLTRTFQLLADLEPALRASSRPRFMFEAALIRLASLGAVQPIEQVLQALGQGAAASPAAPPPSRPAPEKKKPAAGSDVAERLVAAVHDDKPVLGAVLEQSRIALRDGVLTVAFDKGQESMARPLQRRESLDVLRRHAEQIAGGAVEVRVTTPGQDRSRGGRSAAAPPTRAPSRRRPATGASGHGQLLEQAKREPGVSKLLREFGAQVVEIRPLSEPRDLGHGTHDSDTVEEPG